MATTLTYQQRSHDKLHEAHLKQGQVRPLSVHHRGYGQVQTALLVALRKHLLRDKTTPLLAYFKGLAAIRNICSVQQEL